MNLPATQLQVAMVIPHHKLQYICVMYGRELYGSDPIGFLEEDYLPLDSQAIAARIIAEIRFKPTSGLIERIKFQ